MNRRHTTGRRTTDLTTDLYTDRLLDTLKALAAKLIQSGSRSSAAAAIAHSLTTQLSDAELADLGL